MHSLNLIMAVDTNWGISRNSQIPWKSKEDLHFFKQLTTGNIVIMGYNTWVSLPKRPLPNRLNIVITNQQQTDENAIFVNSIHQCIQYLETIHQNYQSAKIYLIGGATILKHFLAQGCSFENIYLTRFDKNYDCDLDIQFLESELKNYHLIETKDITDGKIYHYQ